MISILNECRITKYKKAPHGLIKSMINECWETSYSKVNINYSNVIRCAGFWFQHVLKLPSCSWFDSESCEIIFSDKTACYTKTQCTNTRRILKHFKCWPLEVSQSLDRSRHNNRIVESAEWTSWAILISRHKLLLRLNEQPSWSTQLDYALIVFLVSDTTSIFSRHYARHGAATVLVWNRVVPLE